MHKINVLTFGSKNFNISLEEIKEYLNFNLKCLFDNLDEELNKRYDVLLVHEDYCFNEYTKKDLLNKREEIKILASNSDQNLPDIFNDKLSLPICIKDLNNIIENSLVKKIFNKNSFIEIKKYILDKNEKKLIKDNKYIFLTEKEVQLLELLLNNDKAISKNDILGEVWKYAAEADTHTVETHIYRLRKKIKSKFSDENFILNNKAGYLI